MKTNTNQSFILLLHTIFVMNKGGLRKTAGKRRGALLAYLKFLLHKEYLHPMCENTKKNYLVGQSTAYTTKNTCNLMWSSLKFLT